MIVWESLSNEERAAIDHLEALARMWPKSLWLYSASGTLTVMRRGCFGHHDVDVNLKVATIDIPNDGGDW